MIRRLSQTHRQESQVDSRSFRFLLMTLGKLFTHTRASVIKQYNIVWSLTDCVQIRTSSGFNVFIECDALFICVRFINTK